MAPFAGWSPDDVVRMLGQPDVERRLPLSMGGPAGPTAQVGLRDGRWCLYRMASDDAAWRAFIEQRHASREPLFPEHAMQFLVPGEILLAADDRLGLLAALEQVEVRMDEAFQVQLHPRSAGPQRQSWLRRLSS